MFDSSPSPSPALLSLSNNIRSATDKSMDMNCSVLDKSGLISPIPFNNESNTETNDEFSFSFINDCKHRIIIKWNEISGLQRILSKMNSNVLRLNEQLIIELLSYPELHRLQYISETKEWMTIDVQSIKTHYIGIEYDCSDVNDILVHHSLLDTHPKCALLLNQGLPVWIWIPLLNHNLRLFIENTILVGNISLFLWTIYQMTKYTQGFVYLYKSFLFPILNMIADPIVRQICYLFNLCKFQWILSLISSLFQIFYDMIPIQAMYHCISFFDKYVFPMISQSIHLFISHCKQCHFCQQICQQLFNGCTCKYCRYCAVFIQQMIQCLQRYSSTGAGNVLLEVGKQAKENIGDNEQILNTALSFRSLMENFKSMSNVVWLSFGKPVKHSYDFVKYVHGAVGKTIKICICKCCQKSKAEILRRTSVSSSANVSPCLSSLKSVTKSNHYQTKCVTDLCSKSLNAKFAKSQSTHGSMTVRKRHTRSVKL